jgi:hypothetical protein
MHLVTERNVPNIGIETDGSAGRACNGDLKGQEITMTEAGTASTISAYVQSTGTHSMYAYIYDGSGNLLDQSAERTDISTTAGWHTFTGFTQSLSNATTYVICVGADSSNSCNLYWNTQDPNDGQTTTGFPAYTDATNPVDPATFSGDSTREFSIYLTYTQAASGVGRLINGGLIR